jgi:hypothetical protein
MVRLLPRSRRCAQRAVPLRCNSDRATHRPQRRGLLPPEPLASRRPYTRRSEYIDMTCLPSFYSASRRARSCLRQNSPPSPRKFQKTDMVVSALHRLQMQDAPEGAPHPEIFPQKRIVAKDSVQQRLWGLLDASPLFRCQRPIHLVRVPQPEYGEKARPCWAQPEGFQLKGLFCILVPILFVPHIFFFLSRRSRRPVCQLNCRRISCWSARSEYHISQIVPHSPFRFSI